MSNIVQLTDSHASIPSDAVSVVIKEASDYIRATVYVRRPMWNGYTVETYADGVIAGVNPVLTRDEFKQKFRATDQDLADVANYLYGYGIAILGQYNSSAAVEVEGTAGQFNTAFGTQLVTVTTEKTVYTCYDGHLYVPDYIDDIVTVVDGLDQTLNAQIRPATPFPTGTPVPKPGSTPFVTPQNLANVYNFPGQNNGNDGTGQVVAIILPFGLSSGPGGSGSGYTTQNLTSTFVNTYGISIPTLVPITLNGTTNNPTGPISVECMLDIACVGGIVPKAKILVVFCTSYVSAFTNLLNNVSGQGIPSVISISAANLEAPPGPGGSPLQDQTDTLLAQAATQGVTVCIASGDWGPNNQPLGTPFQGVGPCWPASSPYALAVGGTTLLANNGVWASEVAWNNSADYYITGGNFSIRYPVPSWQNGLSYTTFPGNTTITLTQGSLSSTQGRAIPDVALNSDPYCGVDFFYTDSSNTNTRITSMGTSGATPVWAGLIARQNQISGTSQGFVNSTYYANPSNFRDITSGNNYNPDSPSSSAFLTTVGWDMTTGLGSFIGVAPPPVPRTVTVGGGISIGPGITFN